MAFRSFLGAAFIYIVCTCSLPAQSPIQMRFDSLKMLAEQEPSAEKKADLYNDLAFEYLEVETEKTRIYATKALEIAQQASLGKGIACAYNNLALYELVTNNTQRAIANFEQSKAHYERAGLRKGVADVLGNMGLTYNSVGNNAKSLEYYLRALEVAETISYRLCMANQSLNIATIYQEQGIYDKAIQYDTAALRLFEDIKDLDGVALVWGNLANIFTAQQKNAAALKAYQKTIEYYEKDGNSGGVARNLSNMAALLIKMGDYRSAHTALHRALPLSRPSGDKTLLSQIWENLGEGYFRSYQNYTRRDTTFHLIAGERAALLRQSIGYLQQAVDLADEVRDIQRLKSSTAMLAEAYEQAGDIHKSYAVFKLHAASKDSLNALENQKAIEKLITEREVQIKDKQIELDRLAVEKKRNERLYFGIGIALLLLTMSFIYRNYSNQKHSNIQLTALNSEISDKNTQLSNTLQELNNTQEQLIEVEKQKEKILVRSRISQDIHDDIGSGLSKIAWLSESYMNKVALLGIDARPLEKITAEARDTVSKMGEIVWSSNPERDNLGSLLSFMQKYIVSYMEDAPMRWRIDFPETIPDMALDPELRRNLYLVMKESMHNARKYSGAEEIVVSFSLNDHHYRLAVSDNGIGIKTGFVQGNGNGMNNMRRRIEAVGGQMQVESAPGKGTSMLFSGKI